MLGNRLCRIVLFAVVSLSVAGRARAYELQCNAPAINFDEPLSGGFLVEDVSSSGVLWSDLSGCGLGNFTGGSGSAACLSGVSTNAAVVESSLTTLPFQLGCQSSVNLHFLLNLQRSSPDATLFLEISSDDGLSWSNLQLWQQDVGASFGSPGEEILLDLSPFSFSGLSSTRLRWRYSEPESGASTSSWYVQIDDLSISCVESPRADISVQTLSSHGPAIEGATQDLTYVAKNLGPAEAAGFQLIAALPNGAQLLSASSSLGVVDVQGNNLIVNAGNISLGAEFQLNISTKLASAAMGSGPQATMLFNSSVQSATCDIHLHNNAEIFDLSVLRDWDGDGTPDLSDLCPTDRNRTEPGVRGCLATLSRNVKQVVKVLNSTLAVLRKFEAGTARTKHISRFKDLAHRFTTLTRQSTQNFVSSQSVSNLNKQLSQYRKVLIAFSPRKPKTISKAHKLAESIRLQIIRG